ncbi:MAG: electron transport complex subunit RsxC, partial [Candidatus Competibacteraceae bacterium]
MSKLFPFHGGVKTIRHKTESNQQPIKTGMLPHRLVVPLHQHIGIVAKPVVEVGARVLKG